MGKSVSIDGRKGGAMGIDDENRGSLREVELKQTRVHGNGVVGVQNGVADDNIGCDVVNSRADANEDFGVENEVVGENIGQDVVDSGLEGNFEVGVNGDDLCVDHVESSGEDRYQMIKGVGGIESGDDVVDAELRTHSKGVLKKNDTLFILKSVKKTSGQQLPSWAEQESLLVNINHGTMFVIIKQV